ncbi:hypothetical protein GIB67_037481 [Kingdonia uniflora]|uniref:Wall-associated receptor kinase C-terminal domain-containing protein n=1 Tax=Kingdonia uniflora TaxID=39325 RepID=A0A7J7KXF0_9MAGN|nr:hypothetical protein GIB67_037481 [Kingdonia uniflora]
MIGARGTPGYIAPEVFCRTMGGVSRKSVVYSYGMMLLELDEDLGLPGIAFEKDAEIVKKMALVGGQQNLNNSLKQCESFVGAPVEMDDGVTYKDMIKMDYPEILKKGFLLEWNASHCSECEGSGGRGRLVLCELISSKPAVDINRHRYEIRLANMAINKVQNHLIHELVDPHLGFDSNYSVRKMVTLVAEFAFSTEQADKMDIPSEEFRLLKNIRPLSADSVSDSWFSNSTTPNTSADVSLSVPKAADSV